MKQNPTSCSTSAALVTAAALIGLSQSATADNFIFNANGADAAARTNNWENVGVWYNGTTSVPAGELPQADDDVSVNYDRTANIGSTGNIINNLVLGDATSLDGGTVNINTGGALTVNGNTTLAGNGTGTGPNPSGSLGRTGVINVNGGTLTTNGGTNFASGTAVHAGTATIDNGGTWINRNTATLSNATARGTITITNGTYSFDGQNAGGNQMATNGNASNLGKIVVDGGTFNTINTAGVTNTVNLQRTEFDIHSGTFSLMDNQTLLNESIVNIHGDAATVEIQYLNGALSADFNFFMDSDGVSTVVSTGWSSLANIDVVVDGTDYEGGVGTYTLFQSVNAQGIVAATALAQNFDSSLVASFYLSGNDYIMELSAIPEPGSFALIGGSLALGFVMLRRRK